MKELISVIIPTYNRTKLLANAIHSVQKQTYRNIELLVVDDYGTDDLVEMINEISGNDNRVRYVRNNRKKGVSGARNTGILNASGKYIAFLDSDDEWTANHLECMYNVLEKNKVNIGFTLWYEGKKGFCRALGDDENFKNLLQMAENEINITKGDNFYIFDKDFFQYTIMTYFYCYHLNTMVINRKTLLKYGLFDETLNSSEDCKLLFRLLCFNRFLLYMDHQYYYYYESDSTYSFMDRGNVDLEQIVNDYNIVEKLTDQGLDKIKVREYSWKLLRSSAFCDKEEECRDIIYRSVYNKYITIGVINQKCSLKRSIKYLLKAFGVKKKLMPLKLIIKIYRNRIKNRLETVQISSEYIDFF